MTYEMIERNYKRGLWNAAQVAFAVKAQIITAEQFTEITGEEFTDTPVEPLPNDAQYALEILLGGHDDELD